MKFGMFYEHQLPRPWGPESEHQLLKDALEQVELMDRLGFHCVWEVEHHFLEEPFAGYKGRWFEMPVSNVVPKPLQRPHPPLWVACSRRETIHLAAQTGVGALSFSFIEPAEAKALVDDYYRTIQSEECVPGG